MRRTAIAILTLIFATPLFAQDASRGIVVPFTATGSVLTSERPKAADLEAARVIPGFHAILYPGFKINSKWFIQSTFEVHSKPFYYYEDFYDKKEIKTQVQKLLLGYRWTGEESSVEFKIGKLTTAFGSFPLRYAETVNPLLDQPFAYAYAVKLRPDQIPCGSDDLAHQQTYPVYVHHYCGGATVERDGMIPVTLYGLPAAQIDASWHRVDTRFQLTNSSPANPQDVNSSSQHVQWTAGAGYSMRQGFRVGVSGFRGPFLEEAVRTLLPSGTNERDYPATAFGTDVQWGKGRWNVNAEWQRTEFDYPQFRVPPAVSSGYGEIKATLNPRIYAAVRAALESHGRVEDSTGIQKEPFLPNRQSYEFGVGYHFNRSQMLKASYQWFKTNGVSGSRDNIFGLQFVTTVHSLSKSF